MGVGEFGELVRGRKPTDKHGFFYGLDTDYGNGITRIMAAHGASPPELHELMVTEKDDTELVRRLTRIVGCGMALGNPE